MASQDIGSSLGSEAVVHVEAAAHAEAAVHTEVVVRIVAAARIAPAAARMEVVAHMIAVRKEGCWEEDPHILALRTAEVEEVPGVPTVLAVARRSLEGALAKGRRSRRIVAEEESYICLGEDLAANSHRQKSQRKGFGRSRRMRCWAVQAC